MQQDIIVVGAGMVGLTCVLALAKQGFKVSLVEANQMPPKPLPEKSQAFDNRVVAISRASQQLFMQLDIWPIIENSRCAAYQRMTVWDNTLDGKIDFCAMDYFEPNLGHIVEQQVILGALWQQLTHQSQVRYLWGTQPTAINHHGQYTQLVLSTGETLQAPLVIAADGAHSLLRTLCGIATKGWDYQQKAIVATVMGECSHQQTAFQRFANDGSLALLPLPHPLYSSIVWAVSHAQAAQLCQIEEQIFNRILTREIAQVMGELRLASQRYTFELRTHHAKRYAKNRCVLIGDAAHTLHPLAGQGVNLGLLDVAELVTALTMAKSKYRDFGSERVLARYERRRKWHNQIMIWSMELFKRGFTSQHPIIQQLRNSGLRFVDQQNAIKQLFAKLAMGQIFT